MDAAKAVETDAEALAGNPFLEEWTDAFGAPPFGLIEERHYEPAFEEAMRRKLERELRVMVLGALTP